MNRSGQKTVLEAFRKTLRQELHNIREWPEILWQQMYNRLQWANDEEGKRPVSQVMVPEFQKRTSPGAKSWLHLITRLRESSALLLVLKGHTDFVESCAFSPDGKTVALASEDKTVRLWDTDTGSERFVLSGHSGYVGYVNSCAFSADGKIVASASEDKTVRLWDAQTGEPIEVYACIGSVKCCGFNPLNNMIACGDSGGTVYILDLIGFDSTSLSQAEVAVCKNPAERPGEKGLPERKVLEHPRSHQITKVSSSQKKDIPSERRAAITCKCGYKNPVDERWCKNCGREL